MSNSFLSFLPLLIVLIIFGLIIWFLVRMRRNEKIVIDENGNAVRSGLGGWLILVGLGVVISPFRILGEITQIHVPMFNDGTYEILTTPGTELYHPFWSAFIWGEIVINAFVVIASVALIIVFFSKKKIFPKFYIALVSFSFFFILVDAMLIKVVMPNADIFDVDTAKELIRSLFVAIIWIPYMLFSKRVKVTFIN
jgi:hypothetical protein